MAAPLVVTKLVAPRARDAAVSRARLVELLERGLRSRLTLVSAPAGFGKTTLLASGLSTSDGRQRAVAWLSLEESDRPPERFWTYVVAAVRRAVPDIGDGATALLQTSRPSLESVLATLVNELSTVTTELDLVLDDYHLVDSAEVGAGVLYLLDHLPGQVHLVLSTRVDPALPLARLRARGELVEIRVADLRFTLDEVATYFDDVAAVDLTEGDIAALANRTEGWVAALQLAALSLRGRADPEVFVADFAGDDRYLVDYLVEEVLARQPAEVRDFLLRTCILDRLSGPLCEAVTGNSESQQMLQHLDRSNLFLVPLDATRRWYRYHHLFAEVVLTHLLERRAEDVAELHRRAYRWYDASGDPAAAVRHALASGDVDRAADLAELALPALQRDRQEATIAAWRTALPSEVVEARPVLGLGLVAALMASGQYTGVEERLLALERRLPPQEPDGGHGGPPPGTVVVDRAGWRRAPGALELYRSALSLVSGDHAGTLAHAELAMARAAEDDHLTRAGAAATAGLARWARGDLEEAYLAYSSSAEGLRRAGHISDVLGCSITLADIRITQGRLSEALHTCQEALRLAEDDPAPVTRGTADMHVGISRVAWERNDLLTAAHHLKLSQALGDAAGLPQNPYRRRVAEAHLLAARGSLADAIERLDEAERVYAADFSPDVRPIHALRTRMWLLQGDLAAADSWARTYDVGADQERAYLHEFEHITVAMVLVARGRAEQSPGAARRATALLERLLAAAETGERTGNVIEILVQLALAAQACGEGARATDLLARARALGRTEGHVRVFLDAGVRPGTGPGDDEVPRDTPATVSQPLVDPLSERELDVLRLLASDLAGPAIARELVVSVNTVRTHTRHIYAKLGVTNRREAVRAAARLGLLRRTGT